MRILILVLVIISTLSSCSKVDDYMLGKDNSVNPEPLKPISSSVTISKNWSLAMAKSSDAAAYSKLKPVIHHNIMYTASRSGVVQAVDLAHKKLLWSQTVGKSVSAGPYVASGVLALGTEDSQVVLLQTNDGKKLWQTPVAGQIFSTPLIAHNKVLVKTLDGKIHAFGLSSGEKLWTNNHGAPPLVLKASSSPVLLGSLMLAGFSDGKLDAIDIESGRLIWQKSIAFAVGASDIEHLVDIDADPVVRDNIAYLASYQGFVGAMSLASGEFIWKKTASVYKNMTLAANTLYFTDSNDVLWALNAANGKLLWKQEALKARGATEPVLVGGHVVLGDRSGILHIFSQKTGEEMGREQLAGAITWAPVVSHNTLMVQTASGQLNALSIG